LDAKFVDVAGKHQALFLAVRDNYINAYVEGQSVLKISFGRHVSPIKVRAKIHPKYTLSIHKDVKERDYYVFDGNKVLYKRLHHIECYEGPVSMTRWVAKAQTFAKWHRGVKPLDDSTNPATPEKRGVAAIVARSPNVIDLEMALPADKKSKHPEDQSAPRMDIVALERFQNRARIVGYEAKTFHDSRLRSANGTPEVLKQLSRYERWLTMPDRKKQVEEAYKNCCSLIIQLNDMREPDQRIPLHALIYEVANGNLELEADIKPRLIIFDYKEGDLNDIWKVHKKVLLDTGVEMTMMPRPESIKLPDLRA